MTKIVLIDVDDTLLDFHACAGESMACVLAQYGLPYPEHLLETFTRINNGLWQALERGEITREKLHAVRFDLIFREMGIPLSGPEFETRFRNELKSAAIPVEGAQELLAYLAGKYTVCIASNADEKQQRARLTRAGLLPYVEHLFISQALGADKPSREFFAGCFAQLPGALPEEAVMIGDSLTADIRGARDFGLRTIWFAPQGGTAQAADAPDYTVRSLAEICNIL